MFEIFLILLGIIWIVFAVVQDFKHREIANWLNFSLIIFALGFRFFYSLFSESFMFFYQGLIGLGLFLIIGNLFYYSKIFAGGDAKLMIALGAVLPFSSSFLININLFFWFLFLFLIIAAIYSLIFSFYTGLKNFQNMKKEFLKIFNKNKKLIFSSMIFGVLIIIIDLFFVISSISNLLMFLGIIIIVMPYLYVYAKAVDESSMIKKIPVDKLQEGDWLYNDVKIGKKKIKANWDGLKKQDISLLKKKRKSVKIRQGIVFSPVFLISFILLVLFYKLGFWSFL